jgi:NhaP-type Na+/H+ or K+/H+ antiporter
VAIELLARRSADPETDALRHDGQPAQSVVSQPRWHACVARRERRVTLFRRCRFASARRCCEVMGWQLAITAGTLLGVAAVSRPLTGTWITPPMVFVLIGVLAGPFVIDEITLAPTGETVRTLAEATLAVVLFADASRIKLRVLRHEYATPLRLLGVGLPLTIALGTVLAAAIFTHLNAAEAVILAVLLAPTDAALGQAVVSEPRLPSRVSQGLNVESGLNDGICVPLLLIAVAAADVEHKTATSGHAVRIVSEQLGYGVLGGLAAGAAAVAVVLVAYRRNLVTGPWLQIIPIAGAGLGYGVAVALGGSGFIAAFVAGAIFGALASRESEEASRLNEEIGSLLGGVTFLIFGAVLLGPALKHVSWQIALYAVLSLTLIRLLPVAIAMIGTGARWQTAGFLGWFGPRGLASIVFGVIAVQEARLPGADTILIATYLTIGLSVFAHGITAAPLARRYAHWYESNPHHRREMETVHAPAHRPRGAVYPIS